MNANETSNLAKVSAAIRTLHGRHVRGDLLAVRLFADGRIEFDQKGYGMRQETRRGRLAGNTVHALRHQLKLKG